MPNEHMPIQPSPPDADPLEADPPGNVTCDACWKATPPPALDKQTPVKALPCLKRAVINLMI